MSNISVQELIYVFKIVAYFVGIIGVIIVFSSGILAYFYKSDRSQNNREHTKLFEKTDENSEEIKYIKGSLGL